MANSYLESVKSALDRTKYCFNVISQDKDTAIYTAVINDGIGDMIRTLKVTADGKYSTVFIQTCLESGIPEHKYPDIYKLINQLQNRWYYIRLYLTDDGDLVADYKMSLKRAEASRLFQENVEDVVWMIADLIKKCSVQAHALIREDDKSQMSRLKVEQINLNPFQGGSSYGI